MVYFGGKYDVIFVIFVGVFGVRELFVFFRRLLGGGNFYCEILSVRGSVVWYCDREVVLGIG